jgi:hypothetical protein
MIFKNIIFYYLMITIPLAGLVILNKYHRIDPVIFVWGLIAYAIIYQPLISGLRLLSSGMITAEKFIWNFIPFWNLKYAGFLYLNRRSNLHVSRNE